MFTTNPFAELANVSELITPGVMQTFVVLMVLLVIGGTVLDMVHKKSAKYFFQNAEKAKKKATREVSSSEKKGLVLKTLTNEVLTSSEFSNPKRRLSHLLTMYGFILFIVTTAVMIFAYPTASGDATPAIWPILWHLGAFMLCVGGYWFWFAIRVDVAAEGKRWYQIAPRADMFVLSLLAMCTFALLWSFTSGHGLFFVLFIFSSLVLFGGVLWSKFAHMFFKPAAAYQKKITVADGSRENLPEPVDRADPATRDRHSMELLKDAPINMGLGIKREEPRHY